MMRGTRSKHTVMDATIVLMGQRGETEVVSFLFPSFLLLLSSLFPFPFCNIYL